MPLPQPVQAPLARAPLPDNFKSDLQQQAEEPVGFLRGLQNIGLGLVDAIPTPIKNIIDPIIGRVVVNATPPVGYSQHEQDLTPSNLFKAFVQGTPQYAVDPDPMLIARQALWRHYWGMPNEDKSNTWIQNGNKFLANPTSPTGQYVAQSIRDDIQIHKIRNVGEPIHPDAYNDVIGSFIPGKRDKWNFDLHPDEIPSNDKPYDISQLLRQLAENLSGHHAAEIYTNY